MIYTAITGKYDKPRTDVKCFGRYKKFIDPVRNAKIYKVLSHFYIKDEYCIWIDGNLVLKQPEAEYYKLLGDKDIAVFKHTDRDCVFEEAEVCKELGKDRTKDIETTMNRHKNWPKHNGLGMCFLIIRRQTEEIKRLNEKWWAEICAGSRRDQLTFPIVFNGKVNYIPVSNKKDNEYFKRYGHTTQPGLW